MQVPPIVISLEAELLSLLRIMMVISPSELTNLEELSLILVDLMTLTLVFVNSEGSSVISKRKFLMFPFQVTPFSAELPMTKKVRASMTILLASLIPALMVSSPPPLILINSNVTTTSFMMITLHLKKIPRSITKVISKKPTTVMMIFITSPTTALMTALTDNADSRTAALTDSARLKTAALMDNADLRMITTRMITRSHTAPMVMVDATRLEAAPMEMVDATRLHLPK